MYAKIASRSRYHRPGSKSARRKGDERLFGAIIGGVIGSRFAFSNHPSTDFTLFAPECFITDGGIITFAAAKALMETEKHLSPCSRIALYSDERNLLLEQLAAKFILEFRQKYLNPGYGEPFSRRLTGGPTDLDPHEDNCAAKYVSLAGFAARTDSQAILLAQLFAGLTRGSDEEIQGAVSAAVAVYMARRGALKSEIRQCMEGYARLSSKGNNVRDGYPSNESPLDAVSQAIAAFLESESFEDAIRIAISLDGGCGTIAAITGSIAEAYYGIPQSVRDIALTYLDDELRSIYDEWISTFSPGEEKYQTLTKYIGQLDAAGSSGEGDAEIWASLHRECASFAREHPECLLDPGCDFLSAVPSLYDDSGSDNGSRMRWIQRLKLLKDADWQPSHSPDQIVEVTLSIGGIQAYLTQYAFLCTDQGSFLTVVSGTDTPRVRRLTDEETSGIREYVSALHMEYWHYEYINYHTPGEARWGVTVAYSGRQPVMYEGCDAYPCNWGELLRLFEEQAL